MPRCSVQNGPAPPPPPSSVFAGLTPAGWAAYSAFKRELKVNNLNCEPPNMKEWRELTRAPMQGQVVATDGTAQRREAIVIDPSLLEGASGRRGWKRKPESDDSEEDNCRYHHRHCKDYSKSSNNGSSESKSSESSPEAASLSSGKSSESDGEEDEPRLILMAPKSNLSKQEVKGELMVCTMINICYQYMCIYADLWFQHQQTEVNVDFYNVTSLGRNPFIMRRSDPEPPTPTSGSNYLLITWGKDVDHPSIPLDGIHNTKPLTDLAREMVKRRIWIWKMLYSQKKDPARAEKWFNN
ncbi:uncharacterized protein PHACADRAFT_200520 [Phanerochaete carnosa HHB-10118-sp]|uniref:Uncharacterized protein n=1 Tax=Phanerochaete carnosa (strain HHB-10118-sp) TaxID=650164 RepID=K5ULL6_PHACS|nr:uncharacterized protein PHACADRAFT_200520 [Phanerochaete carnosa HHB-10118-sp]EKM50571.1 hypothetical protein PHACADRAFT_200520 [Phanerochaete carnosa HHB-10118-sp]